MQQRRLRSELRRLRESAGYTQKTAAAGLEWSTSKIIRIETGAVHVSSSDVRALLHFYDISDQLKTEDLLAISRAKEEAWWDAYRSAYRPQFLEYLDFEDSATHVRQFISFVVPGLLQTEEYMRALFQGYMGNDEEWIERAVQVRKRRQQILAPDSGKRAWFIIDEAALHRWIGGPAVTRRQFDRLREMSKQPNINIRLVPFSVGMHPGMRASFTILDFASDDEDSIVSVENPDSDALIKDNVDSTSEFIERFSLLEDIATPEEEIDAALDAVIDRMRLAT
ncbi:MAG TPA: helix-turn-helix transcriptional regulator [Ilumatobacteraceae bacterium]|nr:helix-turn-helix transcriptional regulator [Ilumatobacteraceae bacterium]